MSARPAHITPRERQVLQQLATGAAQTEIARRLGVSPRTIEAHTASLRDKTGCASAHELAIKAATGQIEV